MAPKYLLPIKFITDENSGILIENDDDSTFCIDSNYITIEYNETSRKGIFKVLSEDKNSLFEFYKTLKSIINTMSLFNPQYKNWNMKLEKIDDKNINEKIIELKPQELKKDGNNYYITEYITLKTDVNLLQAIASIKLSTIVKDFKSIHEKIIGNNKIKNQEIILDLYKNSFFQDKPARFLTYMNILELLFKQHHLNEKGIKCINDLIGILDEEYKDKLLDEDDYESIKNGIGRIKRKSITYCVKQIPEDYGVYINNLKYSENMLKDAYDVRSNIAHEGEIIENFEECYNFLEKFIPKLLQKVLNISED